MIFIFWIILSILVGIYATTKGRSGFGFFLLAILLSPLISFLIALLRKPNTELLEKESIKCGESKRCPYCAELIKIQAITCKHCGKDVSYEDNEVDVAEVEELDDDDERTMKDIAEEWKNSHA
ncbi:MAG: zinc ribbon domain-containing protein [Vallitaleaceae bacterium]|nr:zinc ribbon domain-containing protein [Vallitaleaceae bacterium]